MPAREGPNCHGCRHFAVSWDPRLPYLCRLMGFKSRGLPAIEVLRADGMPCQGFVPRVPQGQAVAAPSASPSRLQPGCSLQLSGEPPQPAPALDRADLRRLSAFRRQA